MRARKGMALVAPLAALAVVAAGCGGGSDDNGGGGGGEGQDGGTLIYGEGTDWPQNLFPDISAGNATSVQNILVRILPGAYRVYPDFTVKPDMDLLADEPTNEVSDGVQTVTYHLNPDAVWSDGEPINADDFIFYWQTHRSVDEADGGCPALLATTGYEQMQDVVGADDGQTVTVTYSTPDADWRSRFGALYPSHIMDKGDPAANCEEYTAGWPMSEGLPEDFSGGPWQLKAENIDNTNQTATLTPNENYWGQKPHLDELIHQSVGNDPDSFIPALENGEINMVYPQPQNDLVQRVEALEPNVTSQINFGLSWEHLDMNTRNVHLAHPEIRQAFALALDRQAIVDATVGAFSSDAQVLNNRFYMNNQPEYSDNAPDEYNSRDVDKAKDLIESVGYTMGDDGVYVSPEGDRLHLRLDTTEANKLREDTLDKVVDQLKDAGIEGEKILNPDIFQDDSKPRSLAGGDFDVALFAWISSPFVTGNVAIYQSVENGAQGQNYVHGSDSQVDQLLDQLVSETDPAKQADLGNQIDTQLWEDMYTLPLYQKPTYIAFSSDYKALDSNFEGIGDNATSTGPLWNSETWSIVQ